MSSVIRLQVYVHCRGSGNIAGGVVTLQGGVVTPNLVLQRLRQYCYWFYHSAIVSTTLLCEFQAGTRRFWVGLLFW